MSVTNTYNILCVIFGLILITADFVYSSSDPESLCRELSHIAEVGKGEITVSVRNYPMNHPLKRCNILPDYKEWFVEIKLYKFRCDNKRSYIKFDYVKMCGESVFFMGRFSSNSMHYNYIILNSEDQYARIKYFRPTDTYHSPPRFAHSIPTKRDHRCPSEDEKFYDNYRLVTYNLKTKIYGRSLRCLIEYEGSWQARLQFNIKEASFKCLQSSFTFNNKTTVTGNGFITIDIYDPKLILFIESGCSVDFTLTFTQAVYGRQLPKDTDGLTRLADDNAIGDDGCPILFKKDVPSNKCYSRPSEISLTYEEAKDWCQKQGGELPVVMTMEDLNYFIERAPQKQYLFKYWLGAVRVDNSSFVWEKDHSVLNVTNWNEWEPNNVGNFEEDRIEVYMGRASDIHGKWNDANHRSQNFAICQAEQRRDTQVEPKSGCPAGQYEFQLNSCYSINNYKHNRKTFNEIYNFQLAYEGQAIFCKQEGGQMPGLTEREMEHYFKQPSKIKNQCCVRCQVSKPNYGNIETTAIYASNNAQVGAVQHVAPDSKTVIITAVGCAIVVLFSTAIVLYIIIKHRRNQKTKLSLANVYVNPNIQKEWTIDNVNGLLKTEKLTVESLADVDDSGMKQPIKDYEKAG